MTDAEKLEELARWFDMFDKFIPVVVEALHAIDDEYPDHEPLEWEIKQWVSDNEVQRDLRRIAMELRLRG